MEGRDKEKQREERWKRIRELKYNRWYKEIKGERVPEYLKKGWRESRWKRAARFRMENEVKEGKTERKKRKMNVDYVKERRKHGSMCGKGVESGKRKEGVDKRR